MNAAETMVMEKFQTWMDERYVENAAIPFRLHGNNKWPRYITQG
jgi:hypothetical protein